MSFLDLEEGLFIGEPILHGAKKTPRLEPSKTPVSHAKEDMEPSKTRSAFQEFHGIQLRITRKAKPKAFREIHLLRAGGPVIGIFRQICERNRWTGPMNLVAVCRSKAPVPKYRFCRKKAGSQVTFQKSKKSLDLR